MAVIAATQLALGGHSLQSGHIAAVLTVDNPTADFSDTPWWLSLIKALLIFVYLLVSTLLVIWFERRVIGRMQQRPGPNRNGPFGLLQTLADGMKSMLKEDVTPAAADKIVFTLAPLIAATMAFVSFAIIPFGRPGLDVRAPHAAAADRHPRRGAARARGRFGRRLRHRAGRLVVRVDLPAARWPALDGPGHLLRDRHGPVARRGVPLQRLDVDLADRRRAGAALVHHPGVLLLRRLRRSPWSARPTACPSTSPRARAS